jgi:hypothetical protein
MPNWPVDDEHDFDFDERPVREPVIRKARPSIIRTPEQRVTKTWNGNPVSTMESDHIMNSILFCERKWSEAKSHHFMCFEDKEAFYFLNVYEMFPEYVNLRNEWTRRMKND